MDVVSSLFKKKKRPDEIVAQLKRDLEELAASEDEKSREKVRAAECGGVRRGKLGCEPPGFGRSLQSPNPAPPAARHGAGGRRRHLLHPADVSLQRLTRRAALGTRVA
jgi:hypothetical protein